MTQMMSPESMTSLAHRVATAVLNDAIRALDAGFGTWEQAAEVSVVEAEPVLRLAEDDLGIYTAEEGDEDDEYWREAEYHGYSSPYTDRYPF